MSINFSITPPSKPLPERYFVFNKSYLLINENQLPSADFLSSLYIDNSEKIFLTQDETYSYWGLPFSNFPDDIKENFQSLRSLFVSFTTPQIELANYAFQILHWENDTRFCGHCGQALKNKDTERAKFCDKCSFVSYPHVAPAVIVLVTDGDKMLLAKNALRPSPFYSTLAGFVNPSESLEQTIHREIFEEVGIRVKNIKYFGSQSWPFPNALMVGFTADYDSEEINIDKTEIADAKWFLPSELPEMPPSISIARQLIDSHLRKVKK